MAGCGRSTADWLEQLKATAAADRLHAVHVLQEQTTEKESVIPALTEALKDSDTYVRRDAARALGTFGPAAKLAVPSLLECLRDKEPSVRKAAAQSLKHIDLAAAIKAGVK